MPQFAFDSAFLCNVGLALCRTPEKDLVSIREMAPTKGLGSTREKTLRQTLSTKDSLESFQEEGLRPEGTAANPNTVEAVESFLVSDMSTKQYPSLQVRPRSFPDIPHTGMCAFW